MATTKKKKVKKAATKRAVKPKPEKRKFASGGEIDNEEKGDNMDENAQLQQENNSVEGEPPHAAVVPQQAPAPIPEQAPPPHPPVEAHKEEPVVEQVKEEVAPIEDKAKESGNGIEKEASAGKYILSFFVGAVCALAFGGAVKWDK